MNDEWAQSYRRAFLRKIEKMTYEEALREIPAFIGIFEGIYPERCPKRKGVLKEPFQPKLEEVKCKKSQKNENQPSLF